MTTPEAVARAEAPALPVLRFFDVEGLVEFLETASLPFERWIDDSADAESFLYRRLPEALIHAASAPAPQRRGRLERWWARKEREGEIETVLEQIRTFRLPEVAWIDRWYTETADTAMLWQLQAAAGRCLAIRSTTSRLAAAIAARADQTVLVEPVAYAAATGADAASRPAALRGRAQQAWEREVRAVLQRRHADVDPRLATLAVDVDVAGLVGAVALADGMAARRRQLIERLLRRYGLDVPCTDRRHIALPPPLPVPMVIEQA